MSDLQLIYTSKAGASVIRNQPHNETAIAKAMAALAHRHIEARLMCGTRKIGEVYQRDGRWHWLFDPAYVREHNNAAPLAGREKGLLQ